MVKSVEALIASINDTINDAARLYGDEWDSALVGGEQNYHAITSEKTNDVVVRANDDSLESSWICDYLESVSPSNVKALITALVQSHQESKEQHARIEELESQRKLAFMVSNRWADKCADAEKRIAELEKYEQVAKEYAELMTYMDSAGDYFEFQSMKIRATWRHR